MAGRWTIQPAGKAARRCSRSPSPDHSFHDDGGDGDGGDDGDGDGGDDGDENEDFCAPRSPLSFWQVLTMPICMMHGILGKCGITNVNT